MNKLQKIITIWWISILSSICYKTNQKITQHEIQKNISLGEFDKFDKKVDNIISTIHTYDAAKQNKKQISNQEYFTHEWVDLDLEWWDVSLDKLLVGLHYDLEYNKNLIMMSEKLSKKQKEELMKKINELKKTQTD